MMLNFVDQHRESWGVEPICQILQMAPSGYYKEKDFQANPEKRPPRRINDDALSAEISRVWKESGNRYGGRKVWKQLLRENFQPARCTVERLMKKSGIFGVSRGKKSIRTTYSDPNTPTPEDLVQRDFQADAPNKLWVADFTYVATWVGFVYVAFIIDAFSKFIVGWRVSHRMTADLTLDALEQAIWARKPGEGVIHHSDHGSQYLSIRYSDRLEDADIIPSAGTVGDAYDNALAETINGLYKTEVIRLKGPWKGLEDVEFATLEWVHWYNNKRLMSSIGYVPPVEFEQMYYSKKKERLVESVVTK